jgi:hypothetical protein
MRTFFGILLVAVLAVLAGVAGYYGTAAYAFARGADDGLFHACQTLEVAETKQILTREQRAAIATRMMGPAEAGDEGGAKIAEVFVDYLKGDCSKSVWSELVKRIITLSIPAGSSKQRVSSAAGEPLEKRRPTDWL